METREDVENEVLDRIMKEYDKDNDGSLDTKEVNHMLIQLGLGMNDHEFAKWFKTIDTDNDEKMSRSELAKYMTASDFQTRGFMKALVWSRGQKIGLGANLMAGVTRSSGRSAKTLTVKERESGLLVPENIPVYISTALKIMFKNRLGRTLSSRSKNIMESLSVKQGRKYDDPASKEEIQSFVDLHTLNLKDLVKENVDDYDNFNDFFARALKPERRPIAEPDDDNILISPADCRMMVFPSIIDANESWVKGSHFTIENLLGPDLKDLHKKYKAGSFAIARLSPQDYHRWHMPVSGTHGMLHPIAGALYTVNPIAVNENVDVYTENKRCVIIIDSKKFGKVIMIAIAATMVGSYRMFGPEDDIEKKCVFDGNELGDTKVLEGKEYKKGAVHGEFRFGGSTVLMLFEPGKVVFDEDLIENSKTPIETLLRVNTRIGKSKSRRKSKSKRKSKSTEIVA